MTVRALRSESVLIGAGAFALYAATAAPTIGWWDAAHYPWLATTLGISNPPGSLLLTVLGWLWTRIVWLRPVAHQLNLLAALIGAVTVGLIAATSLQLAEAAGLARAAARWAALAAAGWFATAVLPWTYATQFTPYGLSVCFTSLLLWLTVRWWRLAADADAVPALAWVTFTLGLDVSVHRTNLLLTPALLVAVLLRRPRLLLRPTAIAACAGALAIGAATQLGYLVLALRGPAHRTVEMSSLTDLWRFIRLDPIGGGFLFEVWPRHADLLRVQLADWTGTVWRNLAGFDALRAIALAAMLIGAIDLARRDRRLALFVLSALASAGLGAVVYFNRPEHYLRTLDRHYLASLVPLAMLFGAGVQTLARMIARWSPRLASPVAVSLAGVLVLAAAGGNRQACDRSHTHYAERWARDLLEPLPRDAILFTNGDNDTFPLYYMQECEHVRTDVLVLNRSVLMAAPGIARLEAQALGFEGLTVSDHVIGDVLKLNAELRPAFAAVTVPPDDSSVWAHTRLEGLAFRLLPDSTGASDFAPLTRFVAERIPRVGLAERRQIIEPEMVPLLSNYLFCGVQLARAQWRAGSLAAAVDTLDALEREIDGDRMGAPGETFKKFVHQTRQAIEQSPGWRGRRGS